MKDTLLKTRPASVKARPLRWGNQVPEIQAATAHKRLAILRTAAQLFNERGFYETTLNELAERLHVTKPTLYYYVNSKNDILEQILNTAMQEIDPAIRRAEQADASGMEKLRMFVSDYVAVLCGDFGKCLVISGLSPLDEDSRQKLLPAFRRIDLSVRRIISEGIDDGSIAPLVDPKIAGFALFGALHWMPSWFDASGQFNSREIADRFFSIFQSGLRTSAAPPVRWRPVAKTPVLRPPPAATPLTKRRLVG